MTKISPRRFKKGDLVYRSSAHDSGKHLFYWGIVYDFDKDNDIYIHDFSGESGPGTLLDWQKYYSILTPEVLKNVPII